MRINIIEFTRMQICADSYYYRGYDEYAYRDYHYSVMSDFMKDIKRKI